MTAALDGRFLVGELTRRQHGVEHDARYRQTPVRYLAAVVSGDFGGGDAPAIRADNLKRVPVVGAFRAADFLVNAAHDIGLAQDRVDRLVELPGAIDVAHAVKFRPDAELGEDAEIFRDEMLGHVGGVRSGRRRHIAKRRAEIFLEVLDLAVGNFIHGIVIVDTEKIPNGHTVALQRPEYRVVNKWPPQRADMRAARRRFRVVDRLRSGKALHQFIAPKHRTFQ